MLKELQLNMWWPRSGNIRFIHCPKSREVEGADGSNTTLAEICRTTTPNCSLLPLLPNGHLQTIWTAFSTSAPDIHYKRKTFVSDHDLFHGTFAVDFVTRHCNVEKNAACASLPPRTRYFTTKELHSLPSLDKRPMLVILHGMCGGSNDAYLRHTIAALQRNGQWEICVLNARGCAGSPITSNIPYNARTTWDIRQVIVAVRVDITEIL